MVGAPELGAFSHTEWTHALRYTMQEFKTTTATFQPRRIEYSPTFDERATQKLYKYSAAILCRGEGGRVTARGFLIRFFARAFTFLLPGGGTYFREGFLLLNSGKRLIARTPHHNAHRQKLDSLDILSDDVVT